MGCMMNRSLTQIFIITQATKAIIAKDSAYYRSLILEGKNEQHSFHKPEQILDNSCLQYGSSLSGRRMSAKLTLKANSKIPVSVIPEQGVYMLPTSSVKNKDCVWFSYYHIDYYEQRDQKTYVSFTDGSGLYVNTSHSSFDLQYKRTSQIIARQNRGKLFGQRISPLIPNSPEQD